MARPQCDTPLVKGGNRCVGYSKGFSWLWGCVGVQVRAQVLEFVEA